MFYHLEGPYSEGLSGETRLWRYMDFPKFMSLLQQQILFFAQVARQDDAWEGSYRAVSAEELEGRDLELRKILHNHWMGVRRSCGINCWHINSEESVAMWRLYSAKGQGIAITTTMDQFERAFYDDYHEIWGGRVVYNTDEETARKLDDGSLPSFTILFHKLPGYEYEQEFRLVIDAGHGDMDTWGGVRVCVSDLEALVERVYIAPDAPRWYEGLVREIIEEQELDIQVVQSELGGSPTF